jgi:Leucine-rich repeat (LRR) protein
MKQLAACTALLFSSLSIQAAPFAITNASVDGDTISLAWEPEPERSIVSHSPSMTGQFEYVGAVLATNTASVSNGLDACFYRVRRVTPIPFPDPYFEAAVRDAIDEQGVKYTPTSEVFDVDIESLRSIDCSGRFSEWGSVSNVVGILWLSALTNLDCYYNCLTNLDVSANTNLTNLDCHYNFLTNLDVSSNRRLTELVCSKNNLTNLEVSANTSLTSLDCSYNSLTNLDVSANTGLTRLACSYNFLTNLDVSANTSLVRLGCGGNKLPSFDVSANTNLDELGCRLNNLTNLDLSANPKLRYVDCRDNPITEIIVADTNSLPRYFYYSGNPIIREP